MQLFINIVLIVLIIAIAVAIIVRTFRKVKEGGKCAACDYDCEAKRLKDQHDKMTIK
ncbi:MAG: FeoB-associated Cys-rich membrane protein [Limosilactobacillus sp.]|uniref:FeoB-associated Cys-rich membrane protein n=1 Tax=Limosilactobacillus sp. TaxID=2773925 RepID=UPI0026F96688|nr:FeoB-associated Cys-rich membrane protein [Limosilactobacillus sp.]